MHKRTDTDEIVGKHVLRRLELCHRIGNGAHGMVWKAIEKRTRRAVALKKCFNVLSRVRDAQQMYREIMYLHRLTGHDNIINMQHVILAGNGQDMYITFEYMQTDIFARNRPHIDRHLTGRCCQTSSQIIDGHVVNDVRRCGGPIGSKRRQKDDRMAFCMVLAVFSAKGSPIAAAFFATRSPAARAHDVH